MDNHCTRVDRGSSGGDLGGSLSKNHSRDRVIQITAQEGKEVNIPVNGGECNVGSNPLVRSELGKQENLLVALHDDQLKSRERNAFDVDFGSREGPISGNDETNGMDFDEGGGATACLR